jgi:hypothetical protein
MYPPYLILPISLFSYFLWFILSFSYSRRVVLLLTFSNTTKRSEQYAGPNNFDLSSSVIFTRQKTARGFREEYKDIFAHFYAEKRGPLRGNL